MEKIKTALIYLVKANMGRIILGALLTAIGGSLSNNGVLGVQTNNDIFFWVMIAGLVLIGVHVLIMMIYGWIINPIRERKNKKK